MPTSIEGLLTFALVLWGVKFVGDGACGRTYPALVVGVCMLLIALVLTLS